MSSQLTFWMLVRNCSMAVQNACRLAVGAGSQREMGRAICAVAATDACVGDVKNAWRLALQAAKRWPCRAHRAWSTLPTLLCAHAQLLLLFHTLLSASAACGGTCDALGRAYSCASSGLGDITEQFSAKRPRDDDDEENARQNVPSAGHGPAGVHCCARSAATVCCSEVE